MPRIVVHRTSFEEGTFPPVCCKTGVHADTYETWDFRGVRGRLPITPRAQRTAVRMRRVAWITGALALILAIAGGVLDQPALYAGMAVWIVCVILAVRATPNAKAIGTDAVELSNVHQRFVETIQAAWAQQQPPAD